MSLDAFNYVAEGLSNKKGSEESSVSVKNPTFKLDKIISNENGKTKKISTSSILLSSTRVYIALYISVFILSVALIIEVVAVFQNHITKLFKTSLLLMNRGIMFKEPGLHFTKQFLPAYDFTPVQNSFFLLFTWTNSCCRHT